MYIYIYIYMYAYTCMHVCMYAYTCIQHVCMYKLYSDTCTYLYPGTWLRIVISTPRARASVSAASSFRICLNCAVLKCMFPWRARYQLSDVPTNLYDIMLT